MLAELYKLQDLYASGDMDPPTGWQSNNDAKPRLLMADQKQLYLDYFRAEVRRTIKKLEGGKRLPKLPPKFWTGESRFYWN